DIAGSVAVLSGGAELTDADRKLAQAAAGFLSRQMEM
ncbi:MAG: stage V sporulation protein T, partial [Clostridia bacterium]|nr:stage V sporulation protein T [Clostridia bacterium]